MSRSVCSLIIIVAKRLAAGERSHGSFSLMNERHCYISLASALPSQRPRYRSMRARPVF